MSAVKARAIRPVDDIVVNMVDVGEETGAPAAARTGTLPVGRIQVFFTALVRPGSSSSESPS